MLLIIVYEDCRDAALPRSVPKMGDAPGRRDCGGRNSPSVFKSEIRNEIDD
jgi:hypothetical protein